MGVFQFFLVLATIFVATCAAASDNVADGDFSCLSWRLGVETNNIRDWKTIPKVCIEDVALYMVGDQYQRDSKAVANEAFRYAQSLKLAGDGKDIWVFDIDETVLSHLPFFALHGFGAEPLDRILELLFKWMKKSKAPALPESLKLYRRLLSLGVKVVFLTGKREDLRSVTITNLRRVGYHTWEKLILRDSTQWNDTQTEYKSAERTKLVKSGYRIVGNMGDQWSDLLGAHPGNRTFKLPNPMYYAI